jgi:hypothetical protein
MTMEEEGHGERKKKSSTGGVNVEGRRKKWACLKIGL